MTEGGILRRRQPGRAPGGRSIRSVFPTPEGFVEALKGLKEAGLRDLEAFAPANMECAEPLMPRRGSPVRFISLAAGLTGATLGFWMCIGSALLYSLIVQGKPPIAIIPYCVVGFELTVLVSGVIILFATLGLSRLRPRPLPPDYVPGFGADKFGIIVYSPAEQVKSVMDLLREAGAEEVRDVSELA